MILCLLRLKNIWYIFSAISAHLIVCLLKKLESFGISFCHFGFYALTMNVAQHFFFFFFGSFKTLPIQAFVFTQKKK